MPAIPVPDLHTAHFPISDVGSGQQVHVHTSLFPNLGSRLERMDSSVLLEEKV